MNALIHNRLWPTSHLHWMTEHNVPEGRKQSRYASREAMIAGAANKIAVEHFRGNGSGRGWLSVEVTIP
jgi:hypothetical protein